MIVRVAPSLPTMKTFVYRVPEAWERFLGRFSRVKVYLNRRLVTGFIVSEENEGEGTFKSIVEINEIKDIFPLIDGPLGELCLWASRFYITPLGMVLKFALSYGLDVEPYLKIKATSGMLSHLDGLLLPAAMKNEGRERIFGHFYDKHIELQDIFTGMPFVQNERPHDEKGTGKRLLYIAHLKARSEFYTTEIEKRIEDNRNCLFLLPDYHGISDFYYDFFQKRFKDRVCWFGSKVGRKKRMEAYFKARRKGGYLIFGNRSSIFLPGMRGGLIIVEKPEEILKNIEVFRYDASKIAIERSFIEDIDVIFGGVAPPLETFRDAKEGVFEIIEERKSKSIRFEAIRDEALSRFRGVLSKGITEIVDEAVKNREVIAIYTPKKIYGTSVRCMLCEEPILCKECGDPLNYKKQEDTFFCKACNMELGGRILCPECGSELIYTPFLGTESIEERLISRYKGVHIYSCTGDTLKETLIALQQKGQGSATIIVGSQALTKLYDIPIKRLIVIGWESIPLFSGYRAFERMFQVLQNLIDAIDPEVVYFFMEKQMAVDPVFYLDMDDVYTKELGRRRSALFPPFVRLFSIEIEHPDEINGLKKVEKVVSLIKKKGLAAYLSGPLKERHEKYYRWRFILKGKGDDFYDVLGSIYEIKGVTIEADPHRI